MLGYIDKNKRHKRKKKSFGGSLYIPKREKSVLMPPMENQERRDHMVDTVNHMLIGNAGVGRKTTEPNLPSRPSLNLPTLQPPSITQMPLGGNAIGNGESEKQDMETDVKFVWTGKDMIEGGKRAVNLTKNVAKLGANTGLFALDFAGRVAETAVDGANMAVDVANFISDFTSSRRRRYSDGDDDSPMAIQDVSPETRVLRDAPKEIQDDDEPVFMGQTTRPIEIQDDDEPIVIN